MEMIAFIIWVIIGVMNWVEYLVQKPDEREYGGCSWTTFWLCWVCFIVYLGAHVFILK